MFIHDSAIDRFRARALFATALTLIALVGGVMFGGALSALMHPLTAAIEHLEAATRPATGP